MFTYSRGVQIGHCPAEFNSNLLQHTCLEFPSKTLISWFRCVLIGVGETLQVSEPLGAGLDIADLYIGLVSQTGLK